MSKQNVIVTGAAGFIGSHAAQALLQHGYNVIGVDNFCDFYDRSWKEMNLKSIKDEIRTVEPGVWLGQAWFVTPRTKFLWLYFGLAGARAE